MPSVNDWAAKAAEDISFRFLTRLGDINREQAEARIAAIIATHAKALVTLLSERREHTLLCPKVSLRLILNDQTLMEHDGEDVPCRCGADSWNERVRRALSGEQP